MQNRFSNELKKSLKKAGWFPGRETDAEIVKLDFTMHTPGIRFLKEFGGLVIWGTVFAYAWYINKFYRDRILLASANLPNCLPIAVSWYWCEGELWMDELGQIYQVGDGIMALVSGTVEDALEILVVRKKDIPSDFPKWNITPRPQNPHQINYVKLMNPVSVDSDDVSDLEGECYRGKLYKYKISLISHILNPPALLFNRCLCVVSILVSAWLCILAPDKPEAYLMVVVFGAFFWHFGFRDGLPLYSKGKTVSLVITDKWVALETNGRLFVVPKNQMTLSRGLARTHIISKWGRGDFLLVQPGDYFLVHADVVSFGQVESDLHGADFMAKHKVSLPPKISS
jgi:hypothetical protein